MQVVDVIVPMWIEISEECFHSTLFNLWHKELRKYQQDVDNCHNK